MQRFSDFATEDKPLDGQKKRLDEVINREIVVLEARITDSKFADEGESRRRCVTIQFELDGDVCVLFSGSQVLINQIEKYREHIPFAATIIKIDRYYTFS